MSDGAGQSPKTAIAATWWRPQWQRVLPILAQLRGYRRDWLLRDDSGTPVRNWKPTDGVAFFQTWMSRDSVFIAPRDAQEKIIARWRQWYQESGSHGVGFHTCESMDQWYF